MKLVMNSKVQCIHELLKSLGWKGPSGSRSNWPGGRAASELARVANKKFPEIAEKIGLKPFTAADFYIFANKTKKTGWYPHESNFNQRTPRMIRKTNSFKRISFVGRPMSLDRLVEKKRELKKEIDQLNSRIQACIEAI